MIHWMLPIRLVMRTNTDTQRSTERRPVGARRLRVHPPGRGRPADAPHGQDQQQDQEGDEHHAVTAGAPARLAVRLVVATLGLLTQLVELRLLSVVAEHGLEVLYQVL
jgi:hypothetical protein